MNAQMMTALIGASTLAILAGSAWASVRHTSVQTPPPAERWAPTKGEDSALEEFKQLQAIITRYETQEFQVRTWCLALVGALVAALFADKAKIGGTAFGVVSVLLVAMFGFMELVIRVPKRKAIERVEIVEQMLRGERTLQSPKISESLGTNWDFTTIWKAMRDEAPRLPFAGFYLPVTAIVLVLAIAATSKRTESSVAQTIDTREGTSGGNQRPAQKTPSPPAPSLPASPVQR